MKLMIDTNILLDVLQQRAPYDEASTRVWKTCELEIADGWISAMSFPDIVYILRKELTPEKTAMVYGILALLFRIAELNASDLEQAALMHWNDFEDAVQAVTASRLHCDAIITRNVKDYRNSPVPAMTPEAFLQSLQKVPE